MKKIISSFFIVTCFLMSAQETPPVIKNPLTTYNGLKIDSRKGTLIEKQIFNLGKFKDLNFQKIVLKDSNDNSTENMLGIMIEYETFDQISKKTYTLEKAELSKLIEALQSLQQKENENQMATNTKYKFVMLNNIEFGAVYSENKKSWINYIKLPEVFISKVLMNTIKKS